ncbi:penicillin-binding protein 2 [Metabacillus sp. GX 13764]|uniref:peptidoglycan D,D-transpeptidase FtsI family protein n=1 Tax=Metabacillus kandeliae TaxID=2900151 RepID=UPI001E3E19A1|nr:penicillin-binding protein 2 [Metabacillus kandeliae]MCD7034201.1 penicillin-binding protein 2 [Metabacillus kandeliae]
MTEQQKTNVSEHRKAKKSRQLRINVLFFAVFLVFTVMVLRLGLIQIVEGEQYTKAVTKTDANVAQYPAPRGKIFDRYGRVMVDNKSVEAITYTAESKTKANEKVAAANELGSLISIPVAASKLKDKDFQIYWTAAYPKMAVKLLTKEELKKSPKETYKLQLERVPKEEIDRMKQDNHVKNIVAIFKKFNSGYAYEPQIIKSSNTPQSKKPADLLDETELSRVAESLDRLPGVNVITDWDRVYPFGETMRSLLSGVTTPEQGIPLERKDYFESLGYARNDRVGKGYLESQYEQFLKSHKMKVQYVTDSKGNQISEKVIDPGSRGYDLQLSVDMELQKEVEKIIKEEIYKGKNTQWSSNVSGANLNSAFVVVMDPHTGEVLSMAGKQITKGSIQEFSPGTFTTQYPMGSVVKGATVLTGYRKGLRHGEVQIDGPLKLKDTPVKTSHGKRSLGPINDIHALEQSSNVYMWKTMIRIVGGGAYYPEMKFPADLNDVQYVRNEFSQFGLGVKTGIDLPNESRGQQTKPSQMGNLLDYAIGQFDTYTPLQLSQYVSSIANNGYRVQPHMLSSVHQPTNDAAIGPMIKEQNTKILNRIDSTQSDINRIKEGFHLVTKGASGTARTAFKGIDVSGKTGTAQTNIHGKYSENINFVGYYPASNPEIAFSVVVPYGYKSGANLKIADRVVRAYIALQKQYSQARDPKDVVFKEDASSKEVDKGN